MKALDINTTLIEGYLKLLENLSLNNKLDLISRLSLSIKSNNKATKRDFYDAFGAWEGSQSSEEIINEIKESRVFNRKLDSFE